MGKQISIIIATYNAARTLRKCLDSIVPQLTDEIELIIIDGASKDETNRIVDSYGKKVSVHISEPDKGIYDAWNKGIKVSHGKWIGFIGSDDVMNFGALAKFLTIINDTPNIETYDYICAYNQFIDDNDKILRRIGENPTWDKLRRGNCAAHVASLHNRILFETIGLFNTSFKISADYELLVRKKEKFRPLFFEEYIMKMKVGGMSFSTQALKEVYKIRKIHNTVPMLENVILYFRDWIRFELFIIKNKLQGKSI